MPADGKFYKDCFIKTKCIEDENGIRLDLPFPIYHMTVVCEGRNYYCSLDKSLKDKDVVAYIHYAIGDEDKVKSFKGYLGSDWKDVQKKSEVIAQWSLTKADALSTSDEIGTLTKYDGIDKDKIIHPYPAEDKKE